MTISVKYPGMKGWYDEHSDVGQEIVTTEKVVFGEDGDENAVSEGTRGQVVEVQPGTSTSWYVCEMVGYGRRAFTKKQVRYLSVLELLAEVSA